MKMTGVRSGAVAVSALMALALAGCSSSTPQPSTTSSAPNPNAAACREFGTLTIALPPKIANGNNRPLATLWEDLRVEFDTAALKASGTVKDRMLDLSENWPDSFDVVVMHKFDDINSKIQAVQRACTAEDITVTFGTLTEGS